MGLRRGPGAAPRLAPTRRRGVARSRGGRLSAALLCTQRHHCARLRQRRPGHRRNCTRRRARLRHARAAAASAVIAPGGQVGRSVVRRLPLARAADAGRRQRRVRGSRMAGGRRRRSGRGCRRVVPVGGGARCAPGSAVGLRTDLRSPSARRRSYARRLIRPTAGDALPLLRGRRRRAAGCHATASHTAARRDDGERPRRQRSRGMRRDRAASRAGRRGRC